MLFFSQAAINQNQLGANYSVNQQQINFRIFSANATKVELYLYDQATGVEEVAQYSLTKDNNDIWSTTLDVSALDPRLSNAIYYGYRVWGPNWPYNAV
ncbi:hypothetical protein [Psychrosphaera algicola]|uniref:hypothetical protein n=1 Tax=Psychrosphaera algicola TaxID=3023714 RepID=UPI00351CDC5C